jgi:hypothetical protein
VLKSCGRDFTDLLPLIAAANDTIERTGKVRARASGDTGFQHTKCAFTKLTKPDTLPENTFELRDHVRMNI